MTFGDASGERTPFDYDRFVDWDKRLAREGPFFREEFESCGVHRVIDVGCGTGRHAALFASWGLDVVGVDPTEPMLEQARAHAKASGVDVTFIDAGFGDLVGLRLDPADAVVCTGNALPHVAGIQGLRAALSDFAGVLNPGGLLVLHLLNHDRLIGEGIRVIPPVVRESEDGTWVFLRLTDIAGDEILFDFVTLHRPADAWDSGEDWAVTSRRSIHAALPSAQLVTEVESAGFEQVRLYGDHKRKAFDISTDESVILAARTPGGR